MSAEGDVKTIEPPTEVGESENVDMRTENAGSTPLPRASSNDNAENEAQPENEQDSGVKAEESEDPAPIEVPPSTSALQEGTQEQEGLGYPPIPQGANQQQPQSQQIPPTINQMAIMASAQNKLPVSKVKGIVLRLSRHTESSGQKTGKWFKNENYVDKDSYSWKNMSLFEDHQCHLWTPSGTVRSSYKK